MTSVLHTRRISRLAGLDTSVNPRLCEGGSSSAVAVLKVVDDEPSEGFPYRDDIEPTGTVPVRVGKVVFDGTSEMKKLVSRNCKLRSTVVFVLSKFYFTKDQTVTIKHHQV